MTSKENKGPEDKISRLREALDVCEFEKTEMVLQALIFEHIHDGMILTDPEGKIITWNPAAERMFGFTRQEVLGKTPDIICGLEKTQPSSLEILEEIHKKGFWKEEIPYYRKDGTRGFCEATVIPLPDKDGKPIAFVGIYHDISKRKQVEEMLRESERKFKDIFENALDLIQSVDSQGRFLQVNKQWLETLEYSPEDLPNITLWDIIHPDHQEHCRVIFKEVFDGKAINNVEVVFVSKTGRNIFLEGNINTRIEDGEVIATQGIFRDITKRKLAEEKLKSAHEQTQEANRKIKLAYEKMRELKDHLSIQLRESKMGILIENNGLIIGVSDMIMAVTGLKRNALLTMNIFDLLEDESKKIMKEEIQNASIGIAQPISLKIANEKSDYLSAKGKLFRIELKNHKLFFLLLRESMADEDENSILTIDMESK